MVSAEIEKLNLSKKQILLVIDRLIARWMNNKTENWKYIIQAGIMKGMFGMVPEEKFKTFWIEFIHEVDSVRYENVIEQLPPQFKAVKQSIQEPIELRLGNLVK